MNTQRLIQISQKYREKGLIAQGEFLLEPSVAIEFLAELTEEGIRVVGCDSWAFLDPTDKSPNMLYEIVGGGPLIGKPFENSLDQNAWTITFFIQHSLPPEAEYIVLLVDDPQVKGSLVDFITSPEDCFNQ